VSSELNLTAKDWQEQLYCHIMTVAVLKVEHLGEPRVREVASGVDALYLSGRAALPPSLVERLENARTEAVALDARPPSNLEP
jgi:hypothetical protein